MFTPKWRQAGKDPDYRFSLANERTFLAWIRTALALLAGGVVLDQFSIKITSHWITMAIAISLAVLATILCGLAYLHWRSNEIAMRLEKALPHNIALTITAVFTFLLSSIVTVLLILN